MSEVTGKVALITGGGSGMGRALAESLAADGALVAVCGRRARAARRRRSRAARRSAARALAVPTDVRDPARSRRASTASRPSSAPPELLVNSAAGNFICPAIDLSPNGWRAVVDIVLNGTFYCSRAVARRCATPGAAASILNVVATYAWTGNPGTVHSAAAKAGVSNLTKTLAVEWAPLGIRVNAIAPGPVDDRGGIGAPVPHRGDPRGDGGRDPRRAGSGRSTTSSGRRASCCRRAARTSRATA